MSKFLAYYSPLYDIGGSAAGFKAQFKQHLVDNQWVILEDLATELVVRPPAAEVMGGPLGHSVLRIIFNASTIVFYPTVVNALGSKKGFIIEPSDVTPAYTGTYVQFGPSSSNRVTINLPAISGSVNTSAQKAQAIYDALIASSNAEAQKYDYQLVNDQNRQGLYLSTYNIYVKAVAKQPGDSAVLDIATVGPGITVPKAYSRGQLPGEVARFAQVSQGTAYTELSLPTPYGTGFVYYLSVSQRSLILSVKTTTATDGPLYAQFVEHNEAVAQTPQGCTPVELICGYVGVNNVVQLPGDSVGVLHSTNLNYLRPSHLWGILAGPYTTSLTTHPNGTWKSVFNDRSVDKTEKVEDISGYAGFGTHLFAAVHALGAMLPSRNTPFLNKLQLGAMPHDFIPLYVMGTYVTPDGARDQQQGVLPDATLEDIFLTARTMNNESLHLSADYQTQTALVGALNATDSVINVVSTQNFPDSGTILIGTETITYTGKTATSFTGVSRAREGSVAAAYGDGQPVILQYWLVVMNKMAFRAGYVKPS